MSLLRFTMELNKERIEHILITIINDEDNLSFYETGKDPDKLSYALFPSKIFKAINRTKDGDNESFNEISIGTFLDEIKDKNITTQIFIGYKGNEEQYEELTIYEDLAKHLGITELVTLATKVPKIIAKRFEFFANQTSSKSHELRKLVYKNVKENIVDQVDSLMFQEQI